MAVHERIVVCLRGGCAGEQRNAHSGCCDTCWHDVSSLEM
jgi:hypothetical protein